MPRFGQSRIGIQRVPQRISKSSQSEGSAVKIERALQIPNAKSFQVQHIDRSFTCDKTTPKTTTPTSAIFSETQSPVSITESPAHCSTARSQTSIARSHQNSTSQSQQSQNLTGSVVQPGVVQRYPSRSHQNLTGIEQHAPHDLIWDFTAHYYSEATLTATHDVFLDFNLDNSELNSADSSISSSSENSSNCNIVKILGLRTVQANLPKFFIQNDARGGMESEGLEFDKDCWLRKIGTAGSGNGSGPNGNSGNGSGTSGSRNGNGSTGSGSIGSRGRTSVMLEIRIEENDESIQLENTIDNNDGDGKSTEKNSETLTNETLTNETLTTTLTTKEKRKEKYGYGCDKIVLKLEDPNRLNLSNGSSGVVDGAGNGRVTAVVAEDNKHPFPSASTFEAWIEDPPENTVRYLPIATTKLTTSEKHEKNESEKKIYFVELQSHQSVSRAIIVSAQERVFGRDLLSIMQQQQQQADYLNLHCQNPSGLRRKSHSRAKSPSVVSSMGLSSVSCASSVGNRSSTPNRNPSSEGLGPLAASNGPLANTSKPLAPSKPLATSNSFLGLGKNLSLFRLGDLLPFRNHLNANSLSRTAATSVSAASVVSAGSVVSAVGSAVRSAVGSGVMVRSSVSSEKIQKFDTVPPFFRLATMISALGICIDIHSRGFFWGGVKEEHLMVVDHESEFLNSEFLSSSVNSSYKTATFPPTVRAVDFRSMIRLDRDEGERENAKKNIYNGPSPRFPEHLWKYMEKASEILPMGAKNSVTVKGSGLSKEKGPGLAKDRPIKKEKTSGPQLTKPWKETMTTDQLSLDFYALGVTASFLEKGGHVLRAFNNNRWVSEHALKIAKRISRKSLGSPSAKNEKNENRNNSHSRSANHDPKSSLENTLVDATRMLTEESMLGLIMPELLTRRYLFRVSKNVSTSEGGGRYLSTSEEGGDPAEKVNSHCSTQVSNDSDCVSPKVPSPQIPTKATDWEFRPLNGDEIESIMIEKSGNAHVLLPADLLRTLPQSKLNLTNPGNSTNPGFNPFSGLPEKTKYSGSFFTSGFTKSPMRGGDDDTPMKLSEKDPGGFYESLTHFAERGWFLVKQVQKIVELGKKETGIVRELYDHYNNGLNFSNSFSNSASFANSASFSNSFSNSSPQTLLTKTITTASAFLVWKKELRRFRNMQPRRQSSAFGSSPFQCSSPFQSSSHFQCYSTSPFGNLILSAPKNNFSVANSRYFMTRFIFRRALLLAKDAEEGKILISNPNLDYHKSDYQNTDYGKDYHHSDCQNTDYEGNTCNGNESLSDASNSGSLGEENGSDNGMSQSSFNLNVTMSGQKESPSSLCDSGLSISSCLMLFRKQALEPFRKEYFSDSDSDHKAGKMSNNSVTKTTMNDFQHNASPLVYRWAIYSQNHDETKFKSAFEIREEANWIKFIVEIADSAAPGPEESTCHCNEMYSDPFRSTDSFRSTDFQGGSLDNLNLLESSELPVNSIKKYTLEFRPRGNVAKLVAALSSS